MPTLHIVMPVYNEGPTLEACLERVLAAELPAGWRRAVHLVDDCSDSPADELAQTLVERFQGEGHCFSLHRHDVNRGKGAAIQTGFDGILGSADVADDDVMLIQDADLEYDPGDYRALMAPILERRVAVVIGTRWGKHNCPPGVVLKLHEMGNRFLSFVSNRMTGFRLRDIECCYKVMTIDLLRRMRPQLSEGRFGIEPQMIATLARLKEKVEEVPVQYDPRGPREGKKINWKDGVRAIVVMIRERFRRMPG